MKDQDLPKLFADYLNNLSPDSKLTVNDFFDYVKIPRKYRTDFAFKCIVKQAKERGLIK